MNPHEHEHTEPSTPVEFETRLVELKKIKADVVVPFVLTALQAINAGTVVAVGEKHIQVTMPIVLMQNLIATIQEIDEIEKVDYAQNSFYAPAIPTTDPKGLVEIILALDLCPPDMRVTYVASKKDGEVGYVLVAGPKSDDRKKCYTGNIFPDIRRIMANLTLTAD